jgi:hypothetical protein
MHIAFGFAHLWQQQEFADVDLLLTAAGVDTTDTQQHTLLTVPGHRSILSNSDFIRAQVRAWMAACKFFYARLPGTGHCTPALQPAGFPCCTAMTAVSSLCRCCGGRETGAALPSPAVSCRDSNPLLQQLNPNRESPPTRTAAAAAAAAVGTAIAAAGSTEMPFNHLQLLISWRPSVA